MDLKYEVFETDAVQLWKVLDGVTESMTRLGRLQITQGQERTDAEILKYFGPDLFSRVRAAQTMLETILLQQNPDIEEILYNLRENETDMGYWGHDL